MDGQEPIAREVTTGKVVLMYRWEIIVRGADDHMGTLTVQWIFVEGDGNATFQAAMLEDL
jgi:hypothetical protein